MSPTADSAASQWLEQLAAMRAAIAELKLPQTNGDSKDLPPSDYGLDDDDLLAHEGARERRDVAGGAHLLDAHHVAVHGRRATYDALLAQHLLAERRVVEHGPDGVGGGVVGQRLRELLHGAHQLAAAAQRGGPQ